MSVICYSSGIQYFKFVFLILLKISFTINFIAQISFGHVLVKPYKLTLFFFVD